MATLHPLFWHLMSPEWVTLAFGIIFLILAAVPGKRALRSGTAALGTLGFLIILALCFQTLHGISGVRYVYALVGLNGQVGVIVDGFSQTFKIIFVLGAFLSMLMSFKHLDIEEAWSGEYTTFITFSLFGMMVMASGADLLTLWIGLETMALCVYVLAGYLRRREHSVEGGMKYFLLGAFSSGIYLYGASLIYGATGTINLVSLGRILKNNAGTLGVPLGTGIALLAVGVLFKASLVPFHWWTPDAYEGAPTPITAFMSVAPKAAAFAMLLRIFLVGLIPLSVAWTALIGAVALITMIWGNIAAMLQDNVKRMLAYSSIAHAGYILVGVVAAGRVHSNRGIVAVVFYFLVYAFMNIGAFGLVIYLQRKGNEGDRMEDFDGLVRRSPYMAVLMIFFMLSLGGIPPMAGFVGKFMIFGAAVDAHLYTLAVVLAVTSVVSLYYYFRVIYHMFLHEENEGVVAVTAGAPLAFAVTLCGAAVLGIGVYAQPFLQWAGHAALFFKH